MTAETWRPVVGFPDYRVSDRGRVVSHRRKQAHEMVGSHNQRGYRMVQLRDADGSVSIRTVHRLVADAFLGPRPDGMETRHLDGNKENNAVSNLSFCTPSQNILDQVAHGAHGNARKTKCPRDHPYDPSNTRIHLGRRYCRACARERRTNRALVAANVRAA